MMTNIKPHQAPKRGKKGPTKKQKTQVQSKPLERITIRTDTPTPTTPNSKRIKIISQHHTTSLHIATSPNSCAGATTPRAPPPHAPTSNICWKHAPRTGANETSTKPMLQKPFIPLFNKCLHPHRTDSIEEIPARGT
jgi:hypothetical protein